MNRSDMNKLSYAVEYGYKACEKGMNVDDALVSFWESFGVEQQEEDVIEKKSSSLTKYFYVFIFVSIASWLSLVVISDFAVRHIIFVLALLCLTIAVGLFSYETYLRSEIFH